MNKNQIVADDALTLSNAPYRWQCDLQTLHAARSTIIECILHECQLSHTLHSALQLHKYIFHLRECECVFYVRGFTLVFVHIRDGSIMHGDFLHTHILPQNTQEHRYNESVLLTAYNRVCTQSALTLQIHLCESTYPIGIGMHYLHLTATPAILIFVGLAAAPESIAFDALQN